MYIYTCIHTHTLTLTHTKQCIHTHTHTHTYTHKTTPQGDASLYAKYYMHIYTHTCIHTHRIHVYSLDLFGEESETPGGSSTVLDEKFLRNPV